MQSNMQKQSWTERYNIDRLPKSVLCVNQIQIRL